LLKAAIELDVFTKIADGNQTAQTIAATTGAAERGIRILCDALTVSGFLTKQDGEYDLTPESDLFLNRNSMAYLGAAADFLISDFMVEAFSKLTTAVRNGGTAIPDGGAVSIDNSVWVKFAHGMMPMMMPASQMMAAKLDFPADKKIKVLDIAAGHGIFGISIAQRFADAEIYALDWEHVLEVATENAQKFGVADRHHTIVGNAFEADFGTGYDVILLTNFLHHFDPPTNEKLLEKVRAALTDGGKVLTLEFIPNDDRISPPAEALFSLIMLATTSSGDAYTFTELKQMFENAGFSHNEHHPLTPLPQHMVISGI
jgi:2-polyprenyl-3-methyl-5-hydroxy-6-metoxy-1,4-benzoquinol methylase